jgi:Tfp pilus assembly protein PilX
VNKLASLALRTARLGSTPQRGVAATAAALLLFLAMGIVVAFTNRNLIFEQRTSANQYRYTKAFEMAEAGMEWANVMLNDGRLISTSCAADATGPSSFRDRYLTVNSSTTAITVNGAPPKAVCTVSGTSYTCSCADTGSTAIASSANSGGAFMVTFAATGTNGLLRVEVTGCTSAEGVCHPSASGTPDSTAKITTLMGVLPALGTVPGAAITAKGDVTWSGSGAALGVVNDNPKYNGITINAGGTIDEDKARITTIPGSSPASSIIENDSALSSITPDQMFYAFLGMTKTQFKALAQQSGAVVTCPSNCTSTLENAVNSLGQTSRFIWVDNDMDINGNIAFGTTDYPVVIVVNGNIHLNGTMDVIGLVYAASATWDNTGGGSAFLRGAAVSEGDFTGNGTPDFYFDADVLEKLKRRPGAFVRLPGSWKDY